MTMTIAGADGCRRGWVVVRETAPGAGLAWEVVPSLEHLFGGPGGPDLLALDIPIGLPASGPRSCDIEARGLLGRGRASSVFPAPIRPILGASSYTEASQARRRVEGKGLSVQSWAIVPKIREVDSLLRSEPAVRARVREVHPEICFYFMAGRRPMAYSKKTSAGRAERIAHLVRHFGPHVESAVVDRRHLGCGADDILDALAGLWTARRIRDAIAVTLPAVPPRDAFGLPMEMVA